MLCISVREKPAIFATSSWLLLHPALVDELAHQLQKLLHQRIHLRDIISCGHFHDGKIEAIG